MNPDESRAQTLSKFTPQSDSSVYIRTYAKDVAALTNSPQPTIPAPAKPVNLTSDNDGVTLSAFDPSPMNYKDGVSSKEFKQEVVSLNQEDSDGIFMGKKEPATVPLMPQQSVPITPQVSIPDDSSIITDDRETILARLRAKVAQTPPPTPVPVAVDPQPVVVQETKVVETEPISNQPVQPAETFSPFSRRHPLPPVSLNPANETSNPSPIHTFSSDFADRIDEKQASTFSVLATQSDAGQTRVIDNNKKRSTLPLLAGVFMVIIGLAAIGGAYVFIHKSTPSTVSVSKVPSLITFDESVEVTGTGTALANSIVNVAKGAGVSGNTIVTYISNGGAPQPGGALIKALSLPAPDILLRNIDDSSTVGVIRIGAESHPFFILKVNSYERTFAGMLAWEQSLPTDLSAFYPAYVSNSASNGNATGELTPYGDFTDAVVNNTDVRILRDATGKSVVLYGYYGKDILIIARNEAAFTSLISRLSSTSQ